MQAGAGRRFLIVRARGWTCALPLSEVAETMRPLAVSPVAGVPAFIRGVSVIRGEPTPVISLAALVGGEASRQASRFVLLRVPERRLALEVEEVLGLRELNSSELEAVPPLLRGAGGGHLEVLGTLDERLLGLLSTARLLPEAMWTSLVAGGETA